MSSHCDSRLTWNNWRRRFSSTCFPELEWSQLRVEYVPPPLYSLCLASSCLWLRNERQKACRSVRLTARPPKWCQTKDSPFMCHTSAPHFSRPRNSYDLSSWLRSKETIYTLKVHLFKTTFAIMLICCLKENGPGRDNKEVIFQISPIYDGCNKFSGQTPTESPPWVRHANLSSL